MNSSNSVEFLDPLYWKSVKSVFFFSYSLIFVLASIGNSLVIFIVLRNKTMQTITNVFITNLAVSDILQTIVAVPFTPMAMYLDDWILPMFFCKLLPMTMGISVYVSTLTSTAIAVDRYIVIAHPFIPRMKMKICVILIIVIWMIGSLITLPLAMYHNKVLVNNTNKSQCEEKWVGPKDQELFTACNFVLQFILPGLIISICYFNVGKLLTTRCVNKIGSGVKNRQREEMEIKRKRRTNKMLIAMVTIFVICWTPLNIIWIISEILRKFAINIKCFNLLFLISHVIAMSGNIYNPFLYGWMNSNFRLEFQRVLPCLKISPLDTVEGHCHEENTHFKRGSAAEDTTPRVTSLQTRVFSDRVDSTNATPLLQIPQPQCFNGHLKVSSL